MTGQRALAVDLGGTRLRAALVSDDGKVLYRETRRTPAEAGAEAVVEHIVDACRVALAAAGPQPGVPLGLCAPGPIDARSGVAIGMPTIRGFDGFPLRDVVSTELGLSVVIENDGPAAALGEWKFGAGRNLTDFAYITISTGIGGGIVSDGRLIRGRMGLAGHVGHLPIRPGGAVCFCGQYGHWEAEASGSALQGQGAGLCLA
jgi:glucokinase